MSNKLAPYKDPEIIKHLYEFYEKSGVYETMTKMSVFDSKFLPMVYSRYVKWQAEHDEYIMETLNLPQFDKAFSVAMVSKGTN